MNAVDRRCFVAMSAGARAMPRLALDRGLSCG